MKKSMVGTSGAHITLGDGIVVKHVPEWQKNFAMTQRVTEQGEFLQSIGQHTPHIVPRVLAVFTNGYVMERLTEYHTDDRHAARAFSDLHGLLDILWGNEVVAAAKDVVSPKHWDYVVNRLAALETYTDEEADVRHERLQKMHRQMMSMHLTTVERIHGDATIENMMMRRSSSGPIYEPVLIDPIPASDSMTSLRAVDVGKMLQSAYGYERAKRGQTPLSEYEVKKRVARVLEHEQVSDVFAARYFFAVHIVRLLPYQPPAQRPIFRRWLDDLLEDA